MCENDFGLCACDLLKASPMKVLIGVQEVAAV